MAGGRGLDQSVAKLAGYAVMDGAVGMALGLTVSFAMEAVRLAAQLAGLQAGFGYASTIDPASQADSSLLLVIAELFSGLVFFAAGSIARCWRFSPGRSKLCRPGKSCASPEVPKRWRRLGGENVQLRIAAGISGDRIPVSGRPDAGVSGPGECAASTSTLSFPLKIMSGAGSVCACSFRCSPGFTKRSRGTRSKRYRADAALAIKRHAGQIPTN